MKLIKQLPILLGMIFLVLTGCSKEETVIPSTVAKQATTTDALLGLSDSYESDINWGTSGAITNAITVNGVLPTGVRAAWDLSSAKPNLFGTQIAKSYGMTTPGDISYLGRKMAAFEMRKGDGTIREEITIRATTEGEERIGYVLQFPSKYWGTPDKQYSMIGQFHALEDKNLGEKALPPPIGFFIEDGYFKVTIHTDTHKVSTINSDTEYRYNLGKVPLDQPLVFNWFVKYSPYSDGVILLSINGKKVLEHRGGTTYNDVEYPYFKLGIYKRDWAGHTVERVYASHLAASKKGATWDAILPTIF